MVAGGLKAYYSMSRTRQAFTVLTGPKEKGAREGASCRSLPKFVRKPWKSKYICLSPDRHICCSQMANAYTLKLGRFPQEPSRKDFALFRSAKDNPI